MYDTIKKLKQEAKIARTNKDDKLAALLDKAAKEMSEVLGLYFESC